MKKATEHTRTIKSTLLLARNLGQFLSKAMRTLCISSTVGYWALIR
jgi:hypothetical protein